VNTKRLAILVKAIISLFLFCAFSAVVVFMSFGSVEYWNAWVCIIEFFILESTLAIYLYKKDPELLSKRMVRKEKHKNQKAFTSIAYCIIAICVLVVPGIDSRYAWSNIPMEISIVFMLVMALGFVFQFIIVKQNPYIFRTIEVSTGQTVIEKGLYSIIRHPMYLFGMVIVVSMPIILGSIYGFVIMITLIIPLFVMRILNEEKVLRSELKGYEDYCKKVKYRLIPYVW